MLRVSGYWKVFLGIISVSQRAGGGTLKTKCWLCPFLNAAQNPTPSCNYCSLFPLHAPCNQYSVLFTLLQASMAMCLVHSSTLCRNWQRPVLLSLVWWNVNQRQNVCFNQKLDHIEGFEDCGTERTRSIANHALVFMVRGLHRKWKRPGFTSAPPFLQCDEHTNQPTNQTTNSIMQSPS